MTSEADVFRTHYDYYLEQLTDIELETVQPVLGLKKRDGDYFLPFFGEEYRLSAEGIRNKEGRAPDYGICVIVAKYLLLCPARMHEDGRWAAFKDFKWTSHFLNVNFFNSDTEKVIATAFAGKPDALRKACRVLGGEPDNGMPAYDLAMRFQALPRVSLLLLFSDRDEDFPVYTTVLFQRQAEHYLDPESLAMTSAVLAKRLSAIV